MSDLTARRIGAAAGVIAIAGNVAGVLFLRDVPDAYRPASIQAWVDQVMAHSEAVQLSAVAFTIGLIALARWAHVMGVALDAPSARAAAAAITVGAIMNATGTLAPLVLAAHVVPTCASPADCHPAGAALVGLSLSLDALFNLLLGVGLVAMAPVIWQRGAHWSALLAAVAGAASVPVSLQVRHDWAADWLIVAGPLWLGVVAMTSVQLWRGRL
jgi:hypothetical protein